MEKDTKFYDKYLTLNEYLIVLGLIIIVRLRMKEKSN